MAYLGLYTRSQASLASTNPDIPVSIPTARTASFFNPSSLRFRSLTQRIERRRHSTPADRGSKRKKDKSNEKEEEKKGTKKEKKESRKEPETNQPDKATKRFCAGGGRRIRAVDRDKAKDEEG
jgi:predicted amidophosphoribosyltransferase